MSILEKMYHPVFFFFQPVGNMIQVDTSLSLSFSACCLLLHVSQSISYVGLALNIHTSHIWLLLPPLSSSLPAEVLLLPLRLRLNEKRRRSLVTQGR